MNIKRLSFVKVALSFFFWSLLGPILNLSSLNAYQNIWLISVLAVVYLILYSIFLKKTDEFKMIKFNKTFLIFMFASGFSGVLWLYSLTLLPIANAVFLYSSVPLFTFLLSVLFLKEKISSFIIFAFVLGITGIGILLLGHYQNFSFSIGLVLVLSAAFLTAVQAVVSKKSFLHYPTWITVFLIMLSQSIITSPLALSTSWKIDIFSLIGAIFLSIFSSIVAFFFYVNGFRVLKASTVTLVGYIEPLLAAMWGYLFLQQSLTLKIAIGGVLILIATYLMVKEEENLTIKPQQIIE